MKVFFTAETAMLTDYIRYLFPPEIEGGPCMVSSTHLFGRLLIAHCRETDLPVAKPEGDNVIELQFCHSDQTRNFINKFLWFSKGDMARLNLALRAVFDLDLNTYYVYASQLGFEKKDIIDAFIVSRNLATCDPGDALHKRIYRQEQRQRQKISKLLLRKI